MKNILSALTLLIIMGSCTKNATVEAKVIYSGPVELDGCGWLIEVNGETFKPTNLPAQFQQDQLEVEIKFDELEDMTPCGLSPGYNQIDILEIN